MDDVSGSTARGANRAAIFSPPRLPLPRCAKAAEATKAWLTAWPNGEERQKRTSCLTDRLPACLRGASGVTAGGAFFTDPRGSTRVTVLLPLLLMLLMLFLVVLLLLSGGVGDDAFTCTTANQRAGRTARFREVGNGQTREGENLRRYGHTKRGSGAGLRRRKYGTTLLAVAAFFFVSFFLCRAYSRERLGSKNDAPR